MINDALDVLRASMEMELRWLQDRAEDLKDMIARLDEMKRQKS